MRLSNYAESLARYYPFVPAKAGTQGRKLDRSGMWPLDSRFRGNERTETNQSAATHFTNFFPVIRSKFL
jgi:hypothetical protein